MKVKPDDVHLTVRLLTLDDTLESKISVLYRIRNPILAFSAISGMQSMVYTSLMSLVILAS
jgi:hypothetical protein